MANADGNIASKAAYTSSVNEDLPHSILGESYWFDSNHGIGSRIIQLLLDSEKLVDLEQKGISQLHPNALLQTLNISHKEVVAYDYGSAQLGCDSGEVVVGLLIEGVLQGSNGI
jgi:hypothetical protein